jgi:toxin ParE1/3/4
MAYNLNIKPAAEQDLVDAVNYYDRQRQGLGDEFLDRVRDTFALVRKNPFLSAKSYKEVRQTVIPHFPFVVSFLIEGDCIVIIAVHHGHRDPKTWQSRIES